jgi:hypothetical protein
VVAANVVALALLSGSDGAEPWGERAVQWIEARDRAGRRSMDDLAVFEPADTVHRVCCHQTPTVHDRGSVSHFMSSVFGDDGPEEGSRWGSYVDVSGAALPYLIQDGPEMFRPPEGDASVGPDEVQALEIAADGAVTETIHATALRFLAAPGNDRYTSYGIELADAQALTDRYLAAWSGQASPEMEALYTEDATFLDSLLGVSLVGRAAIGSYSAREGGTPLAPASIPGGGGPALFGYWEGMPGHGTLTAFLAFSGDDDTACPGAQLARMDIEQGRIVAERRYHDVASIRRCIHASELPTGWWTDIVIPASADAQVTKTVTVAGRTIEVRNALDGSEDLVRWAMGRFDGAGLSAPAVMSVSFIDVTDQDLCLHRRGLAVRGREGYRIYLCLTADRVGRFVAQDLILHELAHVWMWDNLSTAGQQQFLTRMGLTSWESPDLPWDELGKEQAAEVIKWGLTDRSVQQNHLFAERTCADLAETFTLLTGVPPSRPPCTPAD